MQDCFFIPSSISWITVGWTAQCFEVTWLCATLGVKLFILVFFISYHFAWITFNPITKKDYDQHVHRNDGYKNNITWQQLWHLLGLHKALSTAPPIASSPIVSWWIQQCSNVNIVYIRKLCGQHRIRCVQQLLNFRYVAELSISTPISPASDTDGKSPCPNLKMDAAVADTDLRRANYECVFPVRIK